MSKLAAGSVISILVSVCGLQGNAQVVISEIMYSPREEIPESAEFLELVNVGDTTVDLSGWTFSAGVKLTFPAGSSIASSQYLVLARDGAVFRQVYGFAPHFAYSGKLDDGGELIRLLNAAGAVVDELEYSDEPPWPVRPDGLGPSLEVIDPRADNALPRNWRACVARAGHTAGRRNSVDAVGLPPWVSSVTYKPRPSPGEQVEVSATVLDAFTVHLVYRVNFESERSVAMTPSGASEAGPTYRASIPGQAANSLVRLRIQALGHTGQNGYPRFDDTVEYTGYFIDDPALATRLPTIHWFIEPGRYERALEHAQAEETEPAVLVYNGQVFDSVQCRVRGGSARWWPKLHWKFVMAKAHDFAMGGRLIRSVDRFNLQGSYSDKTYLREVLSYESFQEAGVASNQSFHVRLHQNGKFFGLYLFLEQPDDDWFKRHGLSEEAAHYKAYSDASPTASPADLEPLYEKENREWEGYSDLWEFLQGVNLPDSQARRAYVLDHVNVPAMVNYLAVNAVIHNNDHVAKNYFLLRDTVGTGRWTMYPWDLDLTFGRNYAGWPYETWGLVLNDWMWADVDVILGREEVSPSHPLFGDRKHEKWDFLWNRIIDAMFSEPDLRDMYFRRLRTLMDLLLPEGRYENRIDALAPLFEPEAQLDAQRWGQYGERQTLQQAIGHLKNEFLAPRRRHLFVTHRVPGGIPEAQSSNLRVVINEIMYAPSGGTDDEYLELFNCSWDEAVDLSGWKISEIQLVIPAGVVIPPRSYAVFVKRDIRFRQTYGGGLFAACEYPGTLPDSGGVLSLVDRAENTVDSVAYSNQPPWPTAPGGDGPSLERIDPDSQDAQAANWQACTYAGGTPGVRNTVSDAASYRAFVPLLLGSPWPMSGLAVSNAGNEPTRLEITAFAADGAKFALSANPVTRLLPPNGQMAELTEELFPGAAALGWAELRGENRGLGSLHLLGNARQLDGGGTPTAQSRTLYLTPMFSGSDAFRGKEAKTYINLANPNNAPATVRLRLLQPGIQTFAPVQAQRTLPAYGMLFSNVSDLFSLGGSLSNAYCVAEVTQGPGVVGASWVEAAAGDSLFCAPPHYPTAAARLFSAQFASLPDLFTEIILLNQASSARQVGIKLWSELGTLRSEAAAISIEAGGMVRLDGRTVLELPPNETVVGSLDIQADGPGLCGAVIFGDSVKVATAASLPLQSEPLFREAIFSQVANGAGYYTGLAFFNPENAPVTIRATVFDAQAKKSGELELVLPPKARRSALLDELIPSTAGQVRGFVHILATAPVVVQQIFGAGAGPSMSAVPPAPRR